MGVSIIGRQWKEFIMYIESDSWSRYGWINLGTVAGTIDGKSPGDVDEWKYENIDSGSRLTITGGDIMEGDHDVAVRTADVVHELKKHFCKF